ASTTCTVTPELKTALESFRFAKHGDNMAALVAKVNRKDYTLVEDETFDSITFEDLVEELPDDAPRYPWLVTPLGYYKFENKGRVSYPLVFVYYCPTSSAPEARMLYASSQTAFQNTVGLGKAHELQDKEQLTEKWLDERLGKVMS
ncbi:hypothetical protein IWQ62_002591, partial [Dispira parvispora]